MPATGPSLNLAQRPFVNTRPVVRAAVLLWVAGFLLLIANVTVFYNYLSGSTEKRAELVRMKDDTERQRQAVSQLQARVASLDLERQNEEVLFLNQKIAERTFSWSQLFDRLTETMPQGVRLRRLAPSGITQEEQAFARAPRRKSGDDRVTLNISAEAKTDEAMDQFIRNLLSHPSFDYPDPTRESREEDKADVLRFDLKVDYLPNPGASSSRPASAEKPVVIEQPAPATSPSTSPTPAAAPAPGATPGPGGEAP